eukprot:scaffold308858_cov33-Tisochrysis_lutea.AAC.1
MRASHPLLSRCLNHRPEGEGGVISSWRAHLRGGPGAARAEGVERRSSEQPKGESHGKREHRPEGGNEREAGEEKRQGRRHAEQGRRGPRGVFFHFT